MQYYRRRYNCSLFLSLLHRIIVCLQVKEVMTGQSSSPHRDGCLTGHYRARLTSDKI